MELQFCSFTYICIKIALRTFVFAFTYIFVCTFLHLYLYFIYLYLFIFSYFCILHFCIYILHLPFTYITYNRTFAFKLAKSTALLNYVTTCFCHIHSNKQCHNVPHPQQQAMSQCDLLLHVSVFHIHHRHKLQQQDESVLLQKVYFFWVCSDTHSFEWFNHQLSELEQCLTEMGRNNFLDYAVCLTRGWSLSQVGEVMMNMLMRLRVGVRRGGWKMSQQGKKGRGLIGNVFDLVLSRNICTNIVGIIYPRPLSQYPRINLRLEPPVEVILAC